MIDQAIEAGLNFIDTANLYGDANEGGANRIRCQGAGPGQKLE